MKNKEKQEKHSGDHTWAGHILDGIAQNIGSVCRGTGEVVKKVAEGTVEAGKVVVSCVGTVAGACLEGIGDACGGI
ncbi:MAG: hypothetical protein FWE31_02705 [Firmicutes bacterium]|nr:hypothetical protein [Bacillota bacterium]